AAVVRDAHRVLDRVLRARFRRAAQCVAVPLRQSGFYCSRAVRKTCAVHAPCSRFPSRPGRMRLCIR
nr:hypothetical protein [Tanacetum cinerariifolium]